MTTTRRIFMGSLAAAPAAILFPPVAAAAPVSIEITQVDDIPVRPDAPPIYFVSRQPFIEGVVRGSSDVQVQGLKRRPDGRWNVMSGPAASKRPGSGAFTWSLPIELEGLNEPETVKCVCVGDRLPPGMIVDGPRWGSVAAETGQLELSCQSFDRGRLQVLALGGRPAIPGVPTPVADFEEVKIRVEGLPLKSLVTIVTEPTNNSRYWPGDRLEVTRDSIVLGNAHFGRIASDPSAKRELDVHAQFWISCVASVLALPARSAGISPQEWLRLSRHIRATSPKVSVVRAFLSGHVQLRITRLGLSNDGVRWLAPRFSRVEGTFMPGQRYRPIKPEIITLLVRGVNSKVWSVASATNLTNNRALWVMPICDLLPAGASPERDSMIAVVVASYLPFDTSKPVTAADIGARLFAISDEVTYRIIRTGSLQ